MQHFDVSDMFGRRQRPTLRLELSEPILGAHGAGRREARIFASLVNDGRASAIAPFVRIEIGLEFRVGPLGFTSRDPGAALQLVTEASQPPAYAVVGTSDFIVHPKIRFQVVELVAEVRDHQDVPQCVVTYLAAARDAPPTEGRLTVESSRIADVLNRRVAGETTRY